MRRSLCWLCTFAAGVACGGEVVVTDGGIDATIDVPFDAPITACSAGAAMLCGASCGNTCPPQSQGGGCLELGDDDGGHLAICNSFDGGIEWSLVQCDECSDGRICVAATSEMALTTTPSQAFGAMVCADTRFAQMYALNGRDDLVRYPDRSAYDGAALPTPSDCPSVAGITLCGGACGACPNGYVCMGRSPSHPHSLCVNDWRTASPPGVLSATCSRDAGSGSCFDGNDAFRCFTFTVDTASQPVADLNSICIDKAICLAAAAGYPGGAFCAGP